ncbi:MAG: VanZ family protein [Anaerolineae bacterium]|nr:VanZ family protein [Anaerolineae bacterium]
MTVFLRRWGPLLLWMVVIYSFSARSNPYAMLPSTWEATCRSFYLGDLCQDEMLGRLSHTLEYALLALLAARAVSWEKRFSLPAAGLAAAISLGYALLDESHQLLVPGRTFQLLDLGLDSLGTLIGLSLFAWLRRHRGG